MQHPTLGRLIARANQQGAYSGTFKYEGKELSFDIDKDGDALEDAIELATKIINALEKYDIAAKAVISKDLLDTYNSGWNEYGEVQEDGTVKTVINPKLSAKEFEPQFKLAAVNICGRNSVELWYQENELFWEHSVCVSSFAGEDFTQAQAQLFG